MNPPLITEDQLKAWLDFKNRADVEKWLKARRIPYDYGRGGAICTTAAAIEGYFTGKKSAGGFEFKRPA